VDPPPDDPTPALCEPHVHLLGWPTAEQTLARIEERIVDWSAYRNAYELAYGEPSTIRAILSNWHLGDPEAEAAFRRLYTFRDADGGSFERFQAKFDLVSWSSALADTRRRMPRAVLCELDDRVAEAAADAIVLGIGRIELRVMLPERWGKESYATMLAQLLASCRRHASEVLQPSIAISLPRGRSMRWWPTVREAALGPDGAFLTAIDLCGCEEHHPLLLEGDLAGELHAFNHQHPERALALLIHVGESYRDRSLESAVRSCHEAAELLGAHRLAHCLALGVDPLHHHGPHQRYERIEERLAQILYDLRHAEALRAVGVEVDEASLRVEAAELRSCDPDRQLAVTYGRHRLEAVQRRQHMAMQALHELDTVIEVCPTANQRIAGMASPREVPLARFLQHGLRVVIGSDNPGLFDTTLTAELDRAAEIAGLDAAGRAALARAAWDCRSEVLSGRGEAPRSDD